MLNDEIFYQIFIMEDLRTPQIREYIATAREFCHYIEKAGSAAPAELLISMQSLLARVYANTALIKKPNSSMKMNMLRYMTGFRALLKNLTDQIQ